MAHWPLRAAPANERADGAEMLDQYRLELRMIFSTVGVQAKARIIL